MTLFDISFSYIYILWFLLHYETVLFKLLKIIFVKNNIYERYLNEENTVEFE